MFTAASFQHILLNLDYLRQHGVDYGNIEWDENYEIPLIRNTPTADPVPLTGLLYFDEGDIFFGYKSFVNGSRQGPWVTTYPDGALEVFGNQLAGSPDGTWYEFHHNGNLRQVAMFCRGRWVARRQYDENGTMTLEEYDMTYQDPRYHIDVADNTRREKMLAAGMPPKTPKD